MEIINKRDIMSPSEDPKPSNHERKLNLKKALNKFYPEEDLESITDALIFAVDKDLIENKEIPLNAQIKEDILMTLEKDRVLIPHSTSKTIAWEDRMLTFRPDEKYEIPHVVRYLIMKGLKIGEYDLDYALTRYLKEIGLTDPSNILTFLDTLYNKVDIGKISADAIANISKELNLESNMGSIIAFLKGGGIISPSLRNPAELKYEVNPLILKIARLKKIT
jgi:hypothetical protein